MKKLTIYVTITALITFMTGGVSYSVTRDEYEQRSGNDSTTMAPGYLNIDKTRTESLKEKVKPKDTSEERIEKIDADLEKSLLETKPEQVKLDLKKKKSSEKDTAPQAVTLNIIGAAGDDSSLDYDVEIGSGTDQRDENGELVSETGKRIVSEVIDGVRHIYAGHFDGDVAAGTATIQDAVDIARTGDMVIIRGGEHAGFIVTSGDGVNRSGIKLYGGYRDNGIRDIVGSKTTINGQIALEGLRSSTGSSGYNTEINGFTVQYDSSWTRPSSWGDNYHHPYWYDSTCGIYADNCENLYLSNNNVTGSVAIFNGDFIHVDNNRITGAGGCDGILVEACNSVEITHNTITSNSSAYGMHFSSFFGKSAAYNYVAYNNINGGVRCSDWVGLHLAYNNISVTGQGKHALYIDDHSGRHIWSHDNNISASGDGAHAIYLDGLMYDIENLFHSSRDYINGTTHATHGTPDISYINTEAYDYASGSRTITQRVFETRTTLQTQSVSHGYENMREKGFMVLLSSDGQDALFLKGDNLATILNGLIQNKDMLISGMEGKLDPELMAKLIEDALLDADLALTLGDLTLQEMEIAMVLVNILNDPTAEQKVILDALEALINEAQKIKGETGSEELKQASDDLTQMVATVLLAQALPGLLKEGDISSIKGIFEKLDKDKSHILLEYQASAKAYYNNVVKELAANITTLQIKDLLSKELTERELEKLPQERIDKIVRRIRDAKDKTITEKQIIKVEAKYREEYLAPAKRILEENMKTLLRGFTRKLFSVLDGAGLVKENTIEGKPILNIDLSAR